MSPEIGQLLTRIAASTSTIRSRGEEADRLSRHGDEQMAERIRELVSRLEDVAAQLEQAIA